MLSLQCLLNSTVIIIYIYIYINDAITINIPIHVLQEHQIIIITKFAIKKNLHLLYLSLKSLYYRHRILFISIILIFV